MLDWVLNTPLYFNPLCLNCQISTDKTTTPTISKHLISDKVYNRVASLAQMAHIKELIWDRNSKNSYKLIQRIYPFYAIVLFLYPLKIWGNPWLNDIFKGYKKGAMIWNWLMNTKWSVQIRDFSWSLFSRVRTEYGDSKSPDSVRIRENTDQKKLQLWTLFTQW